MKQARFSAASAISWTGIRRLEEHLVDFRGQDEVVFRQATDGVCEDPHVDLAPREAEIGMMAFVFGERANAVDEVHLVQKVRDVLPSVSHATVYRNVQELVRAGLVGTFERAGGAVQFEVNPEDHHHFVCRKCGRVWDAYLARVGVRVDRRRSQLKGFHIDRSEVQLHGICARCSNR